MTATPDSSTPVTAPSASAASAAIKSLRFQLDYLDAKLAAILEQRAEEMHQDLAHDLHSAWDAAHAAHAALRALPTEARAFPGLVGGSDVNALLDGFAVRWEAVNEPIASVRSDRSVWAVAEWAAARARYELVFTEVVRPVQVT